MRKYPLAMLLLFLVACALPSAVFRETTTPGAISRAAVSPSSPRPTIATVAAPSPVAVAIPVAVPGTTQKVCQLTGDVDWETGLPTAAKTLTNYGLDAVDLGYPVENQGKLILLFGDSWPSTHPRITSAAQNEVPPDDSVGITTRTAAPDATSCLDLVINHDEARRFVPPTITGPVKVKQGYFNVPSGGVSLRGILFAFFWTDHCMNPSILTPSPAHPLALPQASPTSDCPESDGRSSLGTSVMAQSSNNGLTFSQVVPMPPGFVCATAVNASPLADLPADQRLGIYIFGVPRYRASIPYLAYSSPDTFTDPGSWRFYTGLNANGQPKWVSSTVWSQGSASPNTWSPPGDPEVLIAPSDAGRCVGEFSITYESSLGKWLMLYNCGVGVIETRIAPAPWGPWSEPDSILSAGPEVVCQVVMGAEGCGNRRDFWPALRKNGQFERGWFYAPFVLSRYTRPEPSQDGHRRSTIYWLVSPWNPYEVTVMRTTLEVDSP